MSTTADDGEATRTAIIISADIGLLAPLVEKGGFDIVGAADVAVNGERLAEHLKPDAIIVENELVGVQGWEAMSFLRTASPASQLVLVVADNWTPSSLHEIGAFAVVTRGDFERLVAELTLLDEWLEAQANAPMVERRSGRDRRDHQDWQAIGYEKRDRPPRRQSPT